MYNLPKSPAITRPGHNLKVKGLTPYPVARNLADGVSLHIGEAVDFFEGVPAGPAGTGRDAPKGRKGEDGHTQATVVGTYVTTTDPHYSPGGKARAFIAVITRNGDHRFDVAEAGIPLADTRPDLADIDVAAGFPACGLCGFGLRPTGRAHAQTPHHLLVQRARLGQT